MLWRSICIVLADSASHRFATENTDKVAEKLEELSVKDKASEENKGDGDKKETEKKEDEAKEVKAEEKNWEPRT